MLEESFSFKNLPLSHSFGPHGYFAEKTWQKVIFRKVWSQANSPIGCAETHDPTGAEPVSCYFCLPLGGLFIKNT
jgi:hypothetical protein